MKDYAQLDEEIDFGRVPIYVHVRETVKLLNEDLMRSHFLSKKGLSQ